MSSVKNTALLALLALGVTSLAGCEESKTSQCAGVSKSGQPIERAAGECEKLANATVVMASGQATPAPKYPYNTYVKCYGVAAANMNDCGTATTACGGSVSQAGSPGAWVAIPRAICAQLKGGVIEDPKSSS